MIAFVLRFMIFLPLIELVLVVLVWHAIGAAWTLALLFFGSFLGLTLLRLSPSRTVARVMTHVRRGQAPDVAIWEGMIWGLVGFLLLLPGFFSDFLALALLLGAGRRALGRRRPGPPSGASPTASQEPLEGRFRTHRD